MKTGRERVNAALDFQKPDRAPRDLWTLPYVNLFCADELQSLLDDFPMDIGTARLTPDWLLDVRRMSGQAGQYTDDWGSIWGVGEPGVIGEVRQPALADWSTLQHFQPPWHVLRTRDFGYVNLTCEQTDQFMLSDVTARPFERMQFLRGTQSLYFDIGYGTVEMRHLLEMVHEFYLEDIRGWCQSNVDGIFFMDDWGSNQHLLINPNTWRELFKPLYRDYCNLIHAAHKRAFFHSDGNTLAIFGDLIEVGMDAINSQLFVMDLNELAQYKGRVTFWGEMDRQHILPFGTPAHVKDSVKRVRQLLDDGTGGVIAQCEWGKGNPTTNIRAVYEAWQE
ncbi:MAG TPA: uroporphyrinogen decarboxylase family protein [Anaerolineales bacterium]|nr:uroporphyrinogen decarboxylase family protein [Anaerolineales bacterium]